jgi:RHS repeat-associated protein
VSATGSSKTFEYDANGNLRYEKQPNGTVTREYRWDQQNRLVRVLEGTHESVYEYDGESHRTRIKELVSSSETKNETFVWCGPRICQKRTSNGTTLVRNYFREGFEEGSSDYFYTRDWLGSVREVVGSDGTTIAARLGYDPWGRCTESGSETADFAFSGQYFDRSVGLNLTLYRAYDPRLARWLSRDPIGLQGGLNLYGYVRNDPLNLADLYGLKPVCERDPNNPDDPYIPQPTPPCPGGYDSCVDVCRTTRHQEKGDCYAGGGTYKMCHEVGDEKFTECKESCEQRCKS